MALLSSCIAIARELAKVDSNSLTDTLAIDFANFASMKMRKMLIDKGIDAAPVQEATRDLVDGQGTYLYPVDMFYVPKYVEINWFENPVTTTTNAWKQADKVKINNLPPQQGVVYLRKNQPSQKPMVDYRGDYYEILPTPNASFWGGTSGSGATLSGSLRLFYYLQPVLYTATTDAMTNPEALDYFSFGELIKNTYYYSLEKISKEQLEAYFQAEVGRLVKVIQGDGEMPTRAKGLTLTGNEF